MRTARVYLLYGAVTAEELERIKRYVINPVESREASLAERETLAMDYPEPVSYTHLDVYKRQV